MPIPQLSDTIQLNHSDAGDANAGNGGDGYNEGTINFSPTAYFEASQTVEGAHTKLYNGDDVWQKADWEAGGGGQGGNASAHDGFLAAITNLGAGGAGGDATSNGSQSNTSGGNVAAVSAATTGNQLNELAADQHGTILAGVGGNGGNGNNALGGDISAAVVHTDPETTTTTVNNALDHFVNVLGSIDLHDLGS
ncbi:PE-PGRS family protein [Phyllobacterium sp. BT25]|uniref:PE-PGRS family protein n=1 Tax=Phyllobacterium pellucidum TaxID=2740464 RepID=A0A849VPJ4_9HYPH|nr:MULTISPECIES: hypothetical protein [Phyllobacterium]NTS29873.1 PE-PGRS family protein [Phyllobacterium pellucidum]